MVDQVVPRRELRSVIGNVLRVFNLGGRPVA
jgi:hypothetical protein